MVSTARPILCSMYLSSGWWPLLRRPIAVCSFLDNFDSSMRSSFSPFIPYTQRILSWEISSPSGRTPDGSLHSCSYVEHLDWLQLLFGLVRLPSHSHYPTVAWTPGENYLLAMVLSCEALVLAVERSASAKIASTGFVLICPEIALPVYL